MKDPHTLKNRIKFQVHALLLNIDAKLQFFIFFETFVITCLIFLLSTLKFENHVKRSDINVLDQEKIKREPQLFLPVRPDTLFAPYDIHKQGLQTNRCSVSDFRNYTTLLQLFIEYRCRGPQVLL